MSLWSFLGGRRKSVRSAAPSGKGYFGRPSQVPQQDYQALLETCLKNNFLFEDQNFPADLSSIGGGSLLKKLPPRLQWKRPHELHSNPVFYSAKAKRLGLCQGVIGDCWFLAALEALTFHQDILSRVMPLNQSFTKKYAGIFLFWFWHFGEWVPIVVDDRLPVNEAGQLVFVSSVYKNLFWGALLEKAYAKLCGSYEDLQFGQVAEALVDFTGGVTVTLKLAEAPENLWDILTQAFYGRSLLGCQTHAGKERVLKNGLVDGHAYTLTGIRKVTCSYGPEYLVRLRNPWGKVEWKGDWSDRSVRWDQLSTKEKILLLRKDEDGEFWMSLQDFKTHFVDLIVCKLTPGLMSREVGKKWMYSGQVGRWVKGSTAGGRLKACRDAFWMNPQYQLTVLRADDGRKSRKSYPVLISLIQKPPNSHRNRRPHLPIGFSVFRVNTESHKGSERLPQDFFQKNYPLNSTDFLPEREVSQDFLLELGTYLIIPCTSEARQESEFLLRVFSRKHTLQEVGPNSSFIFSKEIVDKYEGQEEVYKELFEHYPEINAVQLQAFLNRMSWTNLPRAQLQFNLDVCRGILALLDLNTTGTLSIQEFRGLWKRLLIYQEIFLKQERNRSGYLELGQLRAAVQEAGILLSDEVCNLMALRYGYPELKIGFESFVYFMLRVESMEDVFQNLTQDGKGIYLQKPEARRGFPDKLPWPMEEKPLNPNFYQGKGPLMPPILFCIRTRI
ncbi:calpain-14 [Ornithorhynchus anatinus]|uniref:calpain-14 n=1 Tax=Ornithorhynchus anatinus TaxID=9258 RepID=UPI0010A917ED|nr:calpain-14 [Ornithorhynchus anatinus]